MTQARLLLVPLATLLACRGPTEATFDLSTDLPCTPGRTTEFRAGPDVDAVSTRSVRVGCEMQGERGHVGRMVIVPSGELDAHVAVEVVTAPDGMKISDCRRQDGVCSFSRRQLRFSPHEQQTYLVGLWKKCAKVSCLSTETCVEDGSCRSSLVVNPDDCPGAGCGEADLEPAGSGAGGGGGSGGAGGSQAVGGNVGGTSVGGAGSAAGGGSAAAGGGQGGSASAGKAGLGGAAGSPGGSAGESGGPAAGAGASGKAGGTSSGVGGTAGGVGGGSAAAGGVGGSGGGVLACPTSTIKFSGSFTQSANGLSSTQDSGSPCGNDSTVRVVAVSPNKAGTLTIQVSASASFDPHIYVRRTDCQSGILVGSCVDQNGTGLGESFQFPVQPGEVFYIFVGPSDGAGNNWTIKLTL